ncbi:transcription initiation factor IIB [Desulfurococcus mucosus]|uniref:Transcription initiation factor IIB n=1 Tax=Desulfurococcus mucosus (strain ATCC 35584 / DSM 2162 / JCM 9187 / O7/1) TaxID=765177 RepID=E8R7P7_DESM0|nr:transcription initiation factor IIB [Desulfurococcus mucosus]ADV64542.1 Transcription initiation factor IIB (TFIIB) [Desulfurococcus mucosus DSM 2162]
MFTDTPTQSPEAQSSGEESKKPKCPQDKIVYDAAHGEYVCQDTGEVIEEKVIDERPEWRAFTPEERGRRARTGGPVTAAVHDMGFATSIDYTDRDAAGRRLTEKKHELVKLRKWQARTRILTSVERNLAQAMNELDRLADVLNLPSYVKEEAARIYREAVDRGLVRGRSIESVIAAAIYLACREMKVPRSLDEITRHTRIGRKEIARCYRLLLRELRIKVSTTDPADYVPRIVHGLGLPGQAVKLAIEIINTAKEHGVTGGKDPAGLAAAAVYMAAERLGEKKTQKEIAHIAGVTEVTVRNRYKELAKVLGVEYE